MVRVVRLLPVLLRCGGRRQGGALPDARAQVRLSCARRRGRALRVAGRERRRVSSCCCCSCCCCCREGTRAGKKTQLFQIVLSRRSLRLDPNERGEFAVGPGGRARPRDGGGGGGGEEESLPEAPEPAPSVRDRILARGTRFRRSPGGDRIRDRMGIIDSEDDVATPYPTRQLSPLICYRF